MAVYQVAEWVINVEQVQGRVGNVLFVQIVSLMVVALDWSVGQYCVGLCLFYIGPMLKSLLHCCYCKLFMY